MTKTKEKLDKIQTHDLDTERVYCEGNTYTLEAHSPIETDESVPALVYDPEEQTIWSKGGRKLDVKITTFEDDPVALSPMVEIVDSHGMNADWRFGGIDEGDTHQRQQIQKARARALISYAIS